MSAGASKLSKENDKIVLAVYYVELYFYSSIFILGFIYLTCINGWVGPNALSIVDLKRSLPALTLLFFVGSILFYLKGLYFYIFMLVFDIFGSCSYLDYVYFLGEIYFFWSFFWEAYTLRSLDVLSFSFVSSFLF